MSQNSTALLEEAVTVFRLVLKEWPHERKPSDRVEVLMGLGMTLSMLASREDAAVRAAEMHAKALKLSEELDSKEDMAKLYGYLGTIYQTYGVTSHDSMIFYKVIGNSRRISLDYARRSRDALTRAEDMLTRALKLHEELGRKKSMAADYANLGNVYQTRGDMPKACTHLSQAHDLYAQTGESHMVKKVEGWMRPTCR